MAQAKARRAAADAQLNSIAYELLAEEKYSLAKTLLDFAIEVLKKHASADQRMHFVVNRIQAYKWSGDEEAARKLLEREDFSALDDRFKLAEAVLLSDRGRTLKLMRKIGKDGGIHLGHYRDWPLFREFRMRSDFDDMVFEIFGERLAKVVLPPPTPGELSLDLKEGPETSVGEAVRMSQSENSTPNDSESTKTP